MSAVYEGVMPFAARWSRLAAARSPLALGIAPSSKWLGAWGLPDGPGGAATYCKLLEQAAGDSLAAVKVQVPFFLRFGGPGLELLKRTTRAWHDRGSLVLMDAKIGDADDTMDGYADLYLGRGSVIGADAVTANAYMGLASLHPLLVRARHVGAAVFVMVRTSNHATEATQRATGAHGATVAESLAAAVTRWNTEHAPDDLFGPAAAVVGARLPESADLIRRLPRSVLEVPGLGRLDRSAGEVMAPLGTARERALLTVTSGVLSAGPDVAEVVAALARWRATVAEGTPAPS